MKKINMNSRKTREIVFTIRPQMIEQFAELTGDRSPVHFDSQYARRTLHRKSIVHGLLPVSFLLASDVMQKAGNGFFIKKIAVNFAHAVVAGDTLRIVIEYSSPKVLSDDIDIYFKIMTVDDVSLTSGHVVLSKKSNDKKGKRFHFIKDRKGYSLLKKNCKLNKSNFKQIKVDQREVLPFQVAPAARKALKQILELGLKDPLPALALNEVADNFIATLISSTLVGMRLPGQLATFLNLVINFKSSCSLGVYQSLIGLVEFKSNSDKIIVEKLSFCTNNSASSWAEGRLSVKMEKSMEKQISVKSLKANRIEDSLKGKVVLITGASRGIGAVCAKLFSAYGAKVVVNYFQGQKDAQAIVLDIKKNRGKAFAVQADVREKAEVKAMIAKVKKAYGTVDVLVNNAVGDFQNLPFLDLTWDYLQKDLDVIVKGAFNCCQEVLPVMLKNKSGKIINVGTIAAEYPPGGHAKYVTAKNALIGLTRSLAVEFASQNIQVNLVVPSMLKTDLTNAISDVLKEKIAKHNPSGRLASTLDVAQAIVMLASSASAFTTGQKYFVSGGEGPLL